MWFLPVAVSFAAAFVHLLSAWAGRNIRKWISLAGGLAVVAGCFYSMYLNYMSLNHGETLGLLFAILFSLISLFIISYSQWYNPEANYVYDVLLFILLGSINGVVLSHSLIAMYIYWEIMVVVSFFLILFNDTSEARKASFKYIIMTGVGSIFLLFGILGIWLVEECIAWKHLFFASMLIGTGINAGMFPLHAWLSDAHPAAPTPVSAMLSGIVVKTGIYVMIRFYFFLFKPAWSPGWEIIMLFIGAITLLCGNFLALIQRDIKRLFAYSTIGQTGEIFLGIACGTSIGLVAALYHIINHAIFKSLLFMGAGVIIKTTGSRNMEDYGGLARKLPVTFAVMTIAGLSISGLPPFNGFVSKWLICQALLTEGSATAIFAMISGLLGSAITLAYIVKMLRDTFMGVRKNEIVQERLERNLFMTVPMALLAAGCLLFGIFPGVVTERFIFSSIGEFLNLNIGLIKTASFYGWLAIVLFVVVFAADRKWMRLLRRIKIFVGGGIFSKAATACGGRHFYETVRALSGIGKFVRNCAVNMIDFVYSRGSAVLHSTTEKLKLFHNGLLVRYIIWILAGIIILMKVIRR